MQLIKLRKVKSAFRITRRIFREEGITGFYQGHFIGQIHSIVAVSSQFYFYELTTSLVLSKTDPKHAPALRFLCGVMSGCLSTTLVNPLEVIRVRQMIIKDQYGGFFKGASAVYRYGGILAFYEGLGASMLQMGPQVGFTFGVFTLVQPLMLRFLAGPEGKAGVEPVHMLIASSVGGAVAGIVAKTVTYPLDLVKRRLQVGSHRSNPSKYSVPSTAKHLIQCQNLLECLRITYRKEGVWGLYRGWALSVGKTQISNIAAFSTYELICMALRELS